MSARQSTSRSSPAKSPAPKRNRPAPSAARAAHGKAPVEDLDADNDGDEADDEAVEGEIPGVDELSPDDKSPLREDPALDRRIIEGMLRDRKQLLDDLAKEGMTQGAVLRRAAELGLSEALLRQVKGVAADLAGERPGRRPMPSSLGARTCLSCDRVFLSTGPGNRLCMRCRGGDAGLAQF